MPPTKLSTAAATTEPAGSVKRKPRKFAQTLDDSPRGDVHTEARTSRTQAYMASEREREAELEKRGYCF